MLVNNAIKPLLSIVLVLITCFSALRIQAEQSESIDSLELCLVKCQDPTEKVNILLDLSSLYIPLDINKSLACAIKAQELSYKSSEKAAKAITSIMLAKIYFMLSDLGKAMEFATLAKTQAEADGLDLQLAQSLDAIGVIFYDIGDQTKSSENFFTSLKIYEKLDDKLGIGANFCRIGTLYLDQNEYDRAIEFYQKSIELARQIGHKEGIASNLHNLAKVYDKKKEYAEALKYFQEALQINLEQKNSYLAGSNYLSIAEVRLSMKDYEEAVVNVNKARAVFETLGNKLRLAKSDMILSHVYFETGQSGKSESCALNALNIAINNGYRDIIVSSSEILNEIYLTRQDSSTAFRYFILSKQYKDSLALDEKQKTLAKFDLQYRFEKNEQRIKEEKLRKNIAIAIISGFLFFSIVIIFLIWKQMRLRARKQQLEKEKYEKEIEFKNKELVINVMSLMKKNELLTELSEKLLRIEKEVNAEEGKATIRKVAVELQKGQEEEVLKEFSLRFKEVHSEFYDKLLKQFPSLTPNELKLCAFLRLNMSSKDIAALTGQRVSSLETARYRLRQKLGISNEDINLITFLSQF